MACMQLSTVCTDSVVSVSVTPKNYGTTTETDRQTPI